MIFGLTIKELIAVIGLLFDMGGVTLLTFSGIISQKPIKRLKRLRSMNRDDLEEGGPEWLVQEKLKIERASNDPETKEGYDILKTRLERSLGGSLLLILGFILQIISYLI
jgi:hypothetical protein